MVRCCWITSLGQNRDWFRIARTEKMCKRGGNPLQYVLRRVLVYSIRSLLIAVSPEHFACGTKAYKHTLLQVSSHGM